MRNPEIEKAERGVIDSYQLQHLKNTVNKVLMVSPFYRERFAELQVDSSKLRNIADLQILPFTTKTDLRGHYPFGFMAVEKHRLSRIHASSGTTGKPTIIGYTKNDINYWADIIARAILTATGLDSGLIHNAYGYGLFTGGLGLHHGAEKLGMTVIPASAGNTERQITLIEDLKPDILCATPSYALNIAEKMIEMGKSPQQTSLRFGIFGAEPWSEEMRQKLEELFQIKACDIYGLSEVIGPGVAVECHEAQDGLHVAEDHFIIEVINPVTKKPLPEGEEGELVFTSIKKEAFPIIRYRTGDIASITRNKCSCGRTTARMSRIKGRMDDMLIIRGVNVYPSEIELCLLKLQELTPHYQLDITNQGPTQEITLNVEINDSVYQKTSRNLEHHEIKQISSKLKEKLKSACLISIEVNILAPKTLPRSQGKTVRVVDKRKTESLM
ncbi:phenylacetate--CoA ligase family protein [Peribacillus sp. SCS-155]|uniref:phenylacetate--CoA ligase family protein n=1 Tax=Peribacillus sedimenti TaxID=3115297 RepID=UPI00390674D2